MRVAIFSDIHGNIPALEAVLADIKEQSPDEVLIGGDLVGRGPQGDAVVQRLKQTGWRCIYGNHERYLSDFIKGDDIPEAWLREEIWAAVRWMAAELSQDTLNYINALPFTLTSEACLSLHLFHGSPLSDREGLGSWSESELLQKHMDSIPGDMLVCGHTHRSMIREVPNAGWIVNMGSVGLPFNRDPRAQYAILDHNRGQWEVTLRKVPYDIQKTCKIYEQSGFLEGGGVSATLLKMELEQSTSVLVPFLRWAKATHITPSKTALPAFFNVFRPGEPLAEFFQRIGAESIF